MKKKRGNRNRLYYLIYAIILLIAFLAIFVIINPTGNAILGYVIGGSDDYCPSGQTRCSDGVCRTSCTTCPSGQTRCSDGVCRTSCCIGSCFGKDCGDNGCGVSCGNCGSGKKCSNFKCIDNPLCKKNGLECGSSTKTGDCGKCPTGMFCTNGKCCDGCKVGTVRCEEGSTNVLQTCKKYSKCTRWYDSNCKAGMICNKDTKKCESCIPNTCEEYSFWGELFGEDICGEWNNGCYGKLNCGECNEGFFCESGFCKKIECKINQDCGADGPIGNPFCSSCDENVHKKYITYICENPNTYESKCIEIESDFVDQSCAWPYMGCLDGACLNKICTADIDCNTLNEPCPRVCDIVRGTCKPSSSCISSCQMNGICETPEDKKNSNDYNSCTTDYCNSESITSEPAIYTHSCSTTGKISGAPGTWGAIDWKDTIVKIWTVQELVNKFKDEELRKKENEYNNQNIQNFDKIIEQDPELTAAILYKELILKDRLTFVIFYDGSKELDKSYEKKVKDFIKSMANPRINGNPIVVSDSYESGEIRPQFLIIDISCKGMGVFNKMQKIRNFPNSNTHPNLGLALNRIINEVVANGKLKNKKGGKEFGDKITPVLPGIIDLPGNNPGIGIAVYTNIFGSILTYAPNSYLPGEFSTFEMSLSSSIYDKDKPEGYYNIARLGLGPKKSEGIKVRLLRTMEGIFLKLKKPITINPKKC